MTPVRPAIVAAGAIVAGIISARMVSFQWTVWAGLSLIPLCFSIVAILRHRPFRGRTVVSIPAILVFLYCAAAASYSADGQISGTSDLRRYAGVTDSLTIYCVIDDEPRVSNGRLRTPVHIIALVGDDDSISTDGNALLTVFPAKPGGTVPSIPYGAEVAVTGLLEPAADIRNPGEFNYRQYLALHGIDAVISVRGERHVQFTGRSESNAILKYIVFPVRRYVIRTVLANLHGDNAYFLVGLLLGDRSGISDDIKQAFMNTGTIHVLAVSGSHVAIVVMVFFTFFGILRFPPRLKIAATIVMILLYIPLTGSAPSVARASLMAAVYLSGKFFQERVDVYNTLGVSAVLLLVYDPKQLFDVGFQLSFSAVFSIVYFYPKLSGLLSVIPEKWEELRMVRWLWQAFAVSLAAQVGTLPFTAYYFGRISLVSFGANLIVIPLVGLLITAGISGIALGAVSSFVTSCFFEVNAAVSWFTLTFVKLAERVPYATVNTAGFGFGATVIYSIIVGILFHMSNPVVLKRIILAGAVCANIVLFASFGTERQDTLRVTFLDVGQGDAAFIRFPTGQTMLIDAGPSGSGRNAGESTIVPFLFRHGITAIDAVLTTHPHADHLGGVPYVLEHCDVGAVLDQGQLAHSRLFLEYDSLTRRIPHIICRAGSEPLKISGVRLYCLHPTGAFIDTNGADGYSDLNESSIVLKLVYGSTSFLFTGDAETPAEDHMVSVYGDFLDSDVLKAGHHGSITSSSEAFLDCVTPRDVVVSVGAFNKFHHPSPVVLGRFGGFHADVHRTDREGAVIFESDGLAIRRVVWKED